MDISRDKTIEKNYLNRFYNLVIEYEQIKKKEHPTYKKVKDFFRDKRIAHQNFSKYYNRFKQENRSIDSLRPRKRGPKYKIRRVDKEVEDKIIELRKLGINRYEIQRIIRTEKELSVPSLTTIYNYAKKHNLNILNKKMKEERVKIIKSRAGELGHIDCHNLGRNLIPGDNRNYYLVSIVDDCTRLAWGEVIEDLKSLTVMFSVMRCMNMLNKEYGIKFEEILTDNGSEFGNKNLLHKEDHAFERMLIEMGVTHRYTRPYRPQTNGKVERFWKTLHYDLIDETDFESIEEFKDELMQYLVYYNIARPHQGLNGLTPKEFIHSISASI